MLKTEQNTPAMGERVEKAFMEYIGHSSVASFFRTWAVVGDGHESQQVLQRG